uniref:ANK_REP_REGION domain-containing protein n=1 Tax=Macrostomum lignano TaxID=282301 RepID=A0A1I8HQE7_9PLAT
QQQQQQQKKKFWGELCLCFQLFYSFNGDEWIPGNIVITEVIRNKKANISIDRVFPADLSLHGGQRVFIYFTKPLSDQSPDSYEIVISPHGNQDRSCELRLKPIEVKPRCHPQNIIELETQCEQQLRNHLTRGAPHERVNANLRVTCCSTGQQSKESPLIFSDSCATCGQRMRAEVRPLQPPPSKQQRLERANFAVQQDADFSLPKLDIGGQLLGDLGRHRSGVQVALDRVVGDQHVDDSLGGEPQAGRQTGGFVQLPQQEVNAALLEVRPAGRGSAKQQQGVQAAGQGPVVAAGGCRLRAARQELQGRRQAGHVLVIDGVLRIRAANWAAPRTPCPATNLRASQRGGQRHHKSAGGVAQARVQVGAEAEVLQQAVQVAATVRRKGRRGQRGGGQTACQAAEGARLGGQAAPGERQLGKSPGAHLSITWPPCSSVPSRAMRASANLASRLKLSSARPAKSASGQSASSSSRTSSATSAAGSPESAAASSRAAQLPLPEPAKLMRHLSAPGLPGRCATMRIKRLAPSWLLSSNWSSEQSVRQAVCRHHSVMPRRRRADDQPRALSAVHLDGLMPNVEDEIRRRRSRSRGLAWTAYRSIRVILQSKALPDRQRARLLRLCCSTTLQKRGCSRTLEFALLDFALICLLRTRILRESDDFRRLEIEFDCIISRDLLQPTRFRATQLDHSARGAAPCVQADKSVLSKDVPSCSETATPTDRRYVIRAIAQACPGHPAAHFAGTVQAGSSDRGHGDTSSDFDEITRLLQEDKVEINTSNIDGLTALHQACIDNKLELVRFLCEHGADLHARDKEGWTPLHATALGGHTEIAKYLIKRGASLTSANSDGDLPVDVAEQSEMRNLLRTGLPDVEEAAARNAEAAAMLADAIEWRRAGRYRDLRDPVANAGPLHVAAAKGYQQALAELLLCPGVPLEAVDNDGWTALHAAAHWGQAEACRMLVANGANMDALTNANQTVFDLADESVKPLLEELKVKQREIMQEKVMKRPAPVISTLKVEEGRAHSMRRSSVTRLPQSERHDLTLKGAEQEKHPEKLLQGNAVAPATTQSAGLPTAAAATSAVAPPGRSPLASSESLSSDDELRKSTAEARQQLQQPQQRRPTPSPPGFVITTTSESPPPPSQPPPPLPASQSPAPTSVASSSSPASGVVSAKRRIEIIPAGSAAAPTAPESATEAQTSRSKVRVST